MWPEGRGNIFLQNVRTCLPDKREKEREREKQVPLKRRMSKIL